MADIGKTIIYYYSSTGNSLYAARFLQERLPEVELRSIPEELNIGRFEVMADKVGFVFPMHIDGTGNRVAGSLYGHRKVYFVVGKNKIAPTLEEASNRARNIAAPMNAARHKYKTPCAVHEDHCYDCSSPDRICNAQVIYWRKMNHMDMEVVLINEDFGF